MPQEVKISREDPFYNDLNKIFIPFRTVLEMEALVGMYLSVSNYDLTKDIAKSRVSSTELLNALNMKDNSAYYQIIDYFINCAMPRRDGAGGSMRRWSWRVSPSGAPS